MKFIKNRAFEAIDDRQLESIQGGFIGSTIGKLTGNFVANKVLEETGYSFKNVCAAHR